MSRSQKWELTFRNFAVKENDMESRAIRITKENMG
jgi:hypothetical protein